MTRPIYLDHHATTPLDPRVLEAMTPYLTTRFGNASSLHAYGREAREAVETARAEVAALINADPDEIVFTSGATESDNLALKGTGRRLVTVATEHPAVLEPARTLDATVLPVGSDGLLDLERLGPSLGPDILVSVMAANNEIGVLQDVKTIGAMCASRGALLHADAAQAAGKIPLDVKAMDIHLASLSAHKMHGPKGVGALYVRKLFPRVKLAPLMHGGSQEDGRRPGTLNVPAIVGFGRACAIAKAGMKEEAERLRRLRDRLWAGIRPIGGLVLNGHPDRRLPGNLSVSFEGVEGPSLVEALGGLAVSGAAACATGSPKPSHVLRALGRPEPLIAATLRFGIGRFNTEAEIDAAAAAVSSAVVKLRSR